MTMMMKKKKNLIGCCRRQFSRAIVLDHVVQRLVGDSGTAVVVVLPYWNCSEIAPETDVGVDPKSEIHLRRSTIAPNSESGDCPSPQRRLAPATRTHTAAAVVAVVFLTAAPLLPGAVQTAANTARPPMSIFVTNRSVLPRSIE